MTSFDLAFIYLLLNEGTKYTNDPGDSGGPTKFGITKRTYQDFFGRVVLDSEIENMNEATARQIYSALYWHPLSCDRVMNPPVATCIFDTGVLYGVGTSALLTQQALSLLGANLKFDGILGDKSVAFLNIVKGRDFIEAFHGLVLNRIEVVITAYPKDCKFREGWMVRADRLLTLTARSIK